MSLPWSTRKVRLGFKISGCLIFILLLGGAPQQALGSPTVAFPSLQSDGAGQLSVDSLAAQTPTGPDTTLNASAQPRDSASTDGAALKLGLSILPLPYSTDLVSRLPDPERQRPELRKRLLDWEDVWYESLMQDLLIRRNALWVESRPAARRALKQSVDEPVLVVSDDLQPAPADAPVDSTLAPPQGPQLLPDAFAQYADLGMILQGRIELGGGWNRFRPCNVTIQFNCEGSLVPDIKPDIQFGARVGGTVSDRIHVSVDYDNRREFDAANNINVFYQGLDDEIIQRLEVGDVTFPLPQSSFLTEGIPAGNFGFRATGQMGPIEFQTVWAQQKGDVGVRELQVGGDGRGFEQTATTILDDADYELGRFFFLFNPRRFANYPHVDIQELLASDAPTDVRPASTVKVYRYEAGTFANANQVPEGFITAIATASDTLVTSAGLDTVVADTLTGLFRPLVEGEDYILHQSGTWLLLRNTLPDREALALTYRTVDGSEIGTFEAEAQSDAHNADPDNVPPPNLELIKGVNHRPQTATWLREMHHVYRVSGSPGVVESSIRLIISQGDPEVGNTFRQSADGAQLEFLKIFGLDDNPQDNELDLSPIYEATGSSADVTAGPAGTFIALSTLEPFRLPPPLTGVGGPLEGQPFPLEPGDRNVTIYDETNDQLRRGANLYLLTISYRQRFEGFLATISLGAGGVRQGSERVYIDDVELVREEDYTIDYDVGQLELREPERWFRNNEDARVRVTFEQKPLFQLAPTSVFGFQARYGLGTTGELNFIGLSQSEKTLQTRPELGLEPSAVQLGGVSGRLAFQPQWLTNLVDALPGVQAEAPSALTVDGELAMSLPNTNTQGVTYVEDFEGGSGTSISLRSRAWRLGAAPSTTTGAEFVAPPFFEEPNASELVWQDQYVVQTEGGSQVIGGLLPEQIDQELRVEGRATTEPVLWVTAKKPENRQIAPNPNPPSGPAWRSITSLLSQNGRDFTTIEFLEFYVGVPDEFADSLNLIVDLGTVSEDAFAIDSLGLPSGLGRLNREVIPPQVFSTADDIGLWNTGCEAEPGIVAYPLADVRANCTNNNGLEDSEDLNQNSVLDAEERFFRYTVEVGDPTSPYFVRNANTFAGFRFRLFKIPLRRPDHRERVTDAEFQNIRHLRMTYITEANVPLIMARVNFLGSRFLKRGDAGVVAGLGDTVSAPLPSRVEVGPISTLDARYQPPPGITDEVANQTDQFTILGTEFNEQSLNVAFAELLPGDRAEVYLQYTQTPRDFLAYRSLRLWALGIEGPWGLENAPLQFIAKLGEDASNFYLYKTPLPEVPPDVEGVELRLAWLPELRIDMNRFIALRAKAEQLMFQEGGLPGDSTLEVWDVDVFEDGDSSYAVFVAQRSRAPNLAAVRQISLGVYNASNTTVSFGEVWIDDIRLDRPVDNTGVVGRVNVGLRASDFLGFNFSYSSENPYFRQLARSPSFRSASQYRLGGQLEFGRFMPSSWGLRMPITVSYSNSSSAPVLLPRTDIFAENLTGLRNPESNNLAMDVNLSRADRSNIAGVGWLFNNSSLRFSYNQATRQSSRSRTESDGIAGSYSFGSGVADLSLPLFPGFIGKALFFLPRGLRNSRLRLSPETFNFSSSYVNSEALTRRFEEIVQLPSDSFAVPVRTLDQRLQNNMTIGVAPFTNLTGRLTIFQDRQLIPTKNLVTGDASRELINAERSELAGLDIGWETGRSVTNNLTWRPNISPWLIPQTTYNARYRFGRSASHIAEQAGDTVLTRDFNNSRNVRASLGFNLPVFFRSMTGDRGGVLGVFLGAMDQIDIFSFSWSNNLGSTYQRRPATASVGYQLGIGGFNDFRFQDGDTASRVTGSKSFSVASGLRLPLGAGINVDYTNANGTAWTPVNKTDTENRTWPSVEFNWNRLPIPAVAQRWVQGLGFRTGYTVRNSLRKVIGANQDRTTESSTIPVRVTLELTTGWGFNYDYSLTDDERRDATGVTFGDETSYSLSINGRLNLPMNEGAARRSVRVSLGFSQSDRKECRRLGFGTLASDEPTEDGVPTTCEPFTDLRIRRVDLTADTDIRPFVLGLQGSWRDTQSALGQMPGSTQLEISLFGQFLLETGEIR